MRISANTRLTKTQKTATVGLATAAGVVALTAGTTGSAAGDTGRSTTKPVAGHSVSADAKQGAKSAQPPRGDHEKATSVLLAGPTKDHQAKAYQSQDKADPEGKSKAESPERKVKAESPERKVKAESPERKVKAEAQSKVKATAESKAEQARANKAPSLAEQRATKGDNLDSWIKQARSIMQEEGIPGSYQGIKKNIMRESGGDPSAMNDWDVNAQKGTPSKGLLQTIQPTFDAYKVKGTKNSVTDPVANITAACNYAADKYGSMDNVNSAY